MATYEVDFDYWTGMAGLPLKGKPVEEVRLIQNLPRATGALSLVGSLLVIYMIVVSSKSRLSHARNRFLFAMSVLDIPFSLMFALGPVLMPQGAHEQSIGNDATCNMQGWFLQTGYGQPIYNAFFMMYFAMQIMAWARPTPGGSSSSASSLMTLADRFYEPIAHFLSIGFALGTATAGLFLQNGLYGPTPVIGRCLLVPSPFLCQKNPRVECESGWNYDAYQRGFQTIPTLVALAVQLATLLAISAYVVSHAIKMKRKHKDRMRQSGITCTTATERSSSKRSFSGGGNSSYSREVVTTAIIYGLVFFTTYFWSAIVFLRGWQKAKFWMRAMSMAFQPSQGLWTFLIQLRPRFVQVRKAYPEWWWWKVVWVSVVRGSYELPSRQNSQSSSRLVNRKSTSSMDSIRSFGRKMTNFSRRFSNVSLGDNDCDCDNDSDDDDDDVPCENEDEVSLGR
mmetsp:Transcript_20415/g.58582  ORF Transcript_20415/g.58582 Transcript_20415/m.58582 type:complete len:452 (-) Transcript_20415:6546-7901(-)